MLVAIGVWMGTLGYTVFYYGVKLWASTPVTFADALGLGGKKAAK